MDARTFANCIKTLWNIDYTGELRSWMPRDLWERFCANPPDTFIRMDEDQQAKIWAIVEARQKHCDFCDQIGDLRTLHDGWGIREPAYVCERCFTPADDGPCFDDLTVA